MLIKIILLAVDILFIKNIALKNPFSGSCILMSGEEKNLH